MSRRVRAKSDVDERRIVNDWGSLAWLTESNGKSVPGLTVGRVVIKRGRRNPEHLHTGCDEILYLMQGKLRHIVGDDEVTLSAGDVLEIPRNTRHQALSVGDEDADMMVVYNCSERDFHRSNFMDSLVASPVCFPNEDLETVIPRFASLGFTAFEVFTSGFAAAVDLHEPSEKYRDIAHRNGVAFHSLHLPVISEVHPGSVEEALLGVRFAAELGVSIVLYKARTIDDYVENATAVLDRADEHGLTVVLQNHANTVLATDKDVREVLDRVSDERLKVLLEIGHYEKVGVPWQRPFDEFKDRLAYCHLKDMKNGHSVPFGLGSIDFHGLVKKMGEVEYGNGFVVELEARDFDNDPERMDAALRQSIHHLQDVFVGSPQA